MDEETAALTEVRNKSFWQYWHLHRWNCEFLKEAKKKGWGTRKQWKNTKKSNKDTEEKERKLFQLFNCLSSLLVHWQSSVCIIKKYVSKTIEKWPAIWHRGFCVTHPSFCYCDSCRSVCSLVFKSVHKYFTLKSGLNKPYIWSL